MIWKNITQAKGLANITQIISSIQNLKKLKSFPCKKQVTFAIWMA